MDTIKYTLKELLVFETNDPQLKLIQLAEYDKNKLQYGTLKYADGDLYKGYFKNGERHGPGSYTFADSGNKYEGEWEHGLKNGTF